MLDSIRVYTRSPSGYSHRRTRSLRRVDNGSQISELGAGLVLLVVFVLIPMLDLVVVPLRWMMAQELVNSYARTLAMCESFSQAVEAMDADPSLRTKLESLGGVDIKSIDLQLKISRTDRLGASDTYIVKGPGRIPPQWLPRSDNGSQLYSLEVNVYSEMYPAILIPWSSLSIPGVTAPIPMQVRSTHEWGNLGINPRTGNFFINE
jgi:hypothetical protein